MKKVLLITGLLFINLITVFAPASTEFTIIVNKPIQCTPLLQDVLQAIIFVESRYGANTSNPTEPEALGLLQEYPILVDDVNRILGYEKYTLADRANDKKAIEMF